MSEAAKSARAAMKKKIERITTGDPRAKVDASSWTPSEMMNTEAKTGLRPISRRQFKKGGKVVACVGEKSAKRADRKARKDGGKVANEYVNRNVKDANAEFGKPHVGGFKKGGKAKVNDGDSGTRPTGGRLARKDGGRAGKGKTNINIIIGGGAGKQPEMPPSQMAPTLPPKAMPVPPPMPPQAPMGGPPPGLPGAGANMPPPPMARKSGGRVGNRRYRSFKDMDAGSGGGMGRIEKSEIQGKK